MNVAIKKLDSAHESSADDLVHDVFISFYDKMEVLPKDTNVAAYLFTALKNRILNFLRKETFHQQYFKSFSGEIAAVQSHPKSADRLAREIYYHVKQLPEQCRKVFVLKRYENYANKQIAEELGISINTVEQHMRRALRLLRKKMNYKLFLIISAWLYL